MISNKSSEIHLHMLRLTRHQCHTSVSAKKCDYVLQQVMQAGKQSIQHMNYCSSYVSETAWTVLCCPAEVVWLHSDSVFVVKSLPIEAFMHLLDIGSSYLLVVQGRRRRHS